MADPDLGRAKEIFGEALQRPPEDRRAFVEAACGDDDALRRKVQRLVAAHTQAGDFLADPTAVTAIETILQEPEPPPIPERIGRYSVKRVIARGGMGVVYEAVQDHPHRLVALKVLRRGLASSQAMKRFRHEAEILGRLRHPNIAHIHDAGTSDSGDGAQPYFAMELVKGEPLIQYTETRRLGTPQRLELFAKVCDAVQYAHYKGVIHRDLKPDNILVDDFGEPKILDFGIARATDSDIQATTLQTDVRAHVRPPAARPEEQDYPGGHPRHPRGGPAAAELGEPDLPG
ncbi:MAG: serine/threonine-protein kinase [Planctomycetota bacterium]|jgi:predicted unusual protein kinase regulating ubiquinone biosynthesis (AarF/ABC1/UbiB family)